MPATAPPRERGTRPDGTRPGDPAWRARIRHSPTANLTYRAAVGAVGLVVVVIGLILVPLAGPGWLIVLGGVAIWAQEFEWAHRLKVWGLARLGEWTAWIGRQALWVRGVVALATALFVGVVMAVVLAITGVPSWVPDVVQHPLEDWIERWAPVG